MFKLYNITRDRFFTVYHVWSTEDGLSFLVYDDGRWVYLPSEEFAEDEC